MAASPASVRGGQRRGLFRLCAGNSADGLPAIAHIRLASAIRMAYRRLRVQYITW